MEQNSGSTSTESGVSKISFLPWLIFIAFYYLSIFSGAFYNPLEELVQFFILEDPSMIVEKAFCESMDGNCALCAGKENPYPE